MAVIFRQEATYAGEGRWDWSIWIDQTTDHYDRIDMVAWYLHPTFQRPLRWASDPGNGFRISESSWGTFTVKARLYDDRGALWGPHEYKLELTYPDGTPAAEKPTPKVFVSGSLSDAGVIRGLSRELKARGVEVWDLETELQPGQDWNQAVSRAVVDADVVVAIIGSSSGSFVESELSLALSAGKPIVPVVLGGADVPVKLLSRQFVRLSEASDMAPVVSSVMQLIHG